MIVKYLFNIVLYRVIFKCNISFTFEIVKELLSHLLYTLLMKLFALVILEYVSLELVTNNIEPSQYYIL